MLKGTVVKHPKSAVPANAEIYNILYLLKLQIPAFARMTDIVYFATVLEGGSLFPFVQGKMPQERSRYWARNFWLKVDIFLS